MSGTLSCWGRAASPEGVRAVVIEWPAGRTSSKTPAGSQGLTSDSPRGSFFHLSLDSLPRLWSCSLVYAGAACLIFSLVFSWVALAPFWFFPFPFSPAALTSQAS